LGGLGLLTILLDKPAVFGLPEVPEAPAQLDVWQRTVQPVSVGISALSVVATGLAFVIARRQHQREKTVAHPTVEPVETTTAPTPPVVASDAKQPLPRQQEIASGVARPRHDAQAQPSSSQDDVKAHAPAVPMQLQPVQPSERDVQAAPPPKPALPPEAAPGKDDKAQAVAKDTLPTLL